MEEEEEEWRRAIEARSREDRKLAISIQEELDRQKEEAGGGVATRLSSLRGTILDSWRKSPSSSSDIKSVGDKSPGAVSLRLDRDWSGSSSSSASSLRAGASIADVVSGASPRRSPSPNETTAVNQGSKPGKQSGERSTDDGNAIRVDDTSVGEILAMGFSESSARRCLTDANGNVQLAVSMLLSEE